MIEMMRDKLLSLFEMGGPVVMILLAVSILTAATFLYKFWQFAVARVGRHAALTRAIDAWDGGDRSRALSELNASRSYLAPVVRMAMQGNGSDLSDRADAEAEARFAQLERGFSALDMVAQLAPLLGLFGTVLGMIDAFRQLQEAGSAVDPSLLAGGIWVALLTTAAGLVVAMPTSFILSWFEARMRRDRVFANLVLRRVFAPGRGVARVQDQPLTVPFEALAHGA